jgi:hypothetical protein
VDVMSFAARCVEHHTNHDFLSSELLYVRVFDFNWFVAESVVVEISGSANNALNADIDLGRDIIVTGNGNSIV